MPLVIFQYKDGSERALDVPDGWSLMEAARRDELDGIVAECGGGAICGTCHVQVDPAYFARLGAIGASEQALLSIVPERCESSRLACQVIVDVDLDGMCVRVPGEQLGY